MNEKRTAPRRCDTDRSRLDASASGRDLCFVPTKKENAPSAAAAEAVPPGLPLVDLHAWLPLSMERTAHESGPVCLVSVQGEHFIHADRVPDRLGGCLDVHLQISPPEVADSDGLHAVPVQVVDGIQHGFQQVNAKRARNS